MYPHSLSLCGWLSSPFIPLFHFHLQYKVYTMLEFQVTYSLGQRSILVVVNYVVKIITSCLVCPIILGNDNFPSWEILRELDLISKCHGKHMYPWRSFVEDFRSFNELKLIPFFSWYKICTTWTHYLQVSLHDVRENMNNRDANRSRHPQDIFYFGSLDRNQGKQLRPLKRNSGRIELIPSSHHVDSTPSHLYYLWFDMVSPNKYVLFILAT